MFRSPSISALVTAIALCGIASAPTLSIAAKAPANGAGGLEVAAGPSPRSQVRTTAKTPLRGAAAWKRFTAAVGGTWRATWDENTGVPLRVYGSGIDVPGSVADPSVAESHATAFLAQHLTLLAPGARPSDFQLVANEVYRGIRSVGFVQLHKGMPVVGGQVSLRYKNDRLVMLGSEALPNVTSKGSAVLGDAKLRALAEAWILRDRGSVAKASATEGPLLLPIIGSGTPRYHRVMAVTVDAEAPLGKWRVYLDAESGAQVAREQTLRFGDAILEYDVPVRQPLGERTTIPATETAVTVDGQPQESSILGEISWQGAAPATVVTGLTGPFIGLRNLAGSDAIATISAADGGVGTWSEADDELADAQLSAYIHARIAKDLGRVLNPGLAWLDTQLPVNVNIDDACNAFSDGNSINFFIESSQCANTARLADVVYHEFGHSLHANSIIEGVGAFDGAFSEGLSDYLAATITNDPAMGVGFFKSSAPLRHIDPKNSENIWPDDIGEIHFTGLIFAGAMWDLRKLMIEKYGAEDGKELADRFFYGAVQRASNIPATYAEILLEDDDDGDLSNGTPNICDINIAFGAHGLRDLTADAGNLSVVAPNAEGYEVEVRVTGLVPECPGDGVRGATLSWELRGDSTEQEDIAMEAGQDAQADVFVGTIPGAADGDVVRYSVDVEFLDGTTKRFPDNPADPRYEFYVGNIVELFCTDFESDPFEEGWTHELAAGEDGEGADDWQWGAPFGNPASGDPAASYSGTSVVGNDLGGEDFDGKYQANKVNFLLSPKIDIGDYSDVRLQYRRWLNVEDGFFDQGSIYSNDELVWTNFNSNDDNNSTIHHQDREWRFHDVSLAGTAVDGQVQIKYEIRSDGGLELGGWNIDDFCIVANESAVCGDREIYGAEECDNGDENSDTEPDACRTSCLAPSCGDGVLDTGESCDDGNTLDGDGCQATCLLPGEDDGDCGCTVGGSRPWTGKHSALFGIGLLGLVALRRRRRER